MLGSCCCSQDISNADDPECIQDVPFFPSVADVDIFGDQPHLKYARGALPAGPRDRSVPTYKTTENFTEVQSGEAIRRGLILYLKLGETTRQMQISLHVNGFALENFNGDPEEAGREEPTQGMSCLWSPFSLVEKCQVKKAQQIAAWAVFKLTIYRTEGEDQVYYFATSGSDALEERDKWVEEISGCIRQVTASLFPSHADLRVDPLPGVLSTSTRIMAGFLLRCLAASNVSLFYCELHAYSRGHARLSIHKDEWCEREVMSLPLTDKTVVSSGRGDACAIFGVDAHRLCARTKEEKDLWIRAVSNVKVKLMFEAPDPTCEELSTFRAAVGERIEQITPSLEAISRATNGPLLPPMPRLPFPASPRGDIWDNPEPIEASREESPPESETRQAHPHPTSSLVLESMLPPPRQQQRPELGTDAALAPDLPTISGPSSNRLRLPAAECFDAPVMDARDTDTRDPEARAHGFDHAMEYECTGPAVQLATLELGGPYDGGTVAGIGSCGAAVPVPCPGSRCEADAAAGEGNIGVLMVSTGEDEDAPKIDDSLDVPARRCMCRSATSRLLGACARRRNSNSDQCWQPADV